MVNTTGKELNLSHGNVSKSLLAVAGPALQSECDKKKFKNFDYGDIVVTGGHGLQCQYVYHGACKGWDNGAGNCEKVSVLQVFHHYGNSLILVTLWN